ncbi:hypothetical protein M0805_001835 [Coniferiporia weirii]|nr:hypothetical protein M0805_001835 [Coniferiporia weirii]
MSTLANAVFNDNSDDENDPDFVPDDISESEAERSAKEQEPAQDRIDEADKEAEREAQKAARASLWESFQSSVASTSTSTPSTSTASRRLVKIEKKYRFAGEVVTEIAEVPEDSDDAKKWPLWNPRPPVTQDRETAEDSLPTPALQPVDTSTPPTPAAGLGTPEPASSDPCVFASASPPAPSQSTSQTPGTSRPRAGPRRPKTSLVAPPVQTKPKKLTTLEKSAMDWRAHVSGGSADASPAPEGAATDNLADELERNRRGGGYLEKVAFLERVGQRREELFEEGRKKRRKG